MIKTNKYKISNYKIKNKQKIILISDIHLWENYNTKILDNIEKEIKLLKPNIICLCGDIIDEFRFLNKLENEKFLLNFLNKLTLYAKTIITLGSHDFFNLKKNKTANISSKAIEYWHKMIEKNNNPQLILLDNDIYETKDLRIIGYTPSREYYASYENEDILISEINNKIIKHSKKNKYTILMCHTPLSINKESLKKINFTADLILAGHMHDGLVFPILKKLPTTIGLISPQKKLFPKNARRKKQFIIKGQKTNLIITGGICKFSSSAPLFFQKFNFLYNNDIDFIEISN